MHLTVSSLPDAMILSQIFESDKLSPGSFIYLLAEALEICDNFESLADTSMK